MFLMNNIIFCITFMICILYYVDATIYNADIIVYESTPSGIMASIAASNNTNLSVILLSTSSHIGGMCSGGLGRTDM